MAKNETDSGLFVALNYFSHLTLCLSQKMRRCFKSSNIFKKTSDIFHSLAVTDSTTLESGITSLRGKGKGVEGVVRCLSPCTAYDSKQLTID